MHRSSRKHLIVERKRWLHAILPRVETRLLSLDRVNARGVDLFRAVCEADLEGIVAKWKYGPYHTDATS